MSSSNPTLVEVTRGSMVESRHTGAFAVVNALGETVLSQGDIERPTYARSAIKPLQGLPLIESGAADAFGLTQAQIALSCASHNSEARHVEAVCQWLKHIGLGEATLECGAHLPYHESTAHAMLRQGTAPGKAHNNCSGKHAGFLTTAQHLGESVEGYIRADHPVQARLRAILEQMTDTDLRDAPTGADGCGIPVIGMSLQATAYAMARFGSPDRLGEARATAARRIFDAVNAEPFMIAGSDRFCTGVMADEPGRMLVKTGAEGYFCAALPREGLGIALKIDDGSKRASEPAMAALLASLLDSKQMMRRACVTQHNVGGTEIGEIKATGV